MFSLLIFSLLCLHSVALVEAALFIFEPFQGTTCHGGQPCTVTWEDDGVQPLLSAIGISTVALFTGNQQLVQTLPPVNVATTSHFTFNPLPAAGPDSDDYYIAFTSTQINNSNGLPYVGYSAFFQLRGMSGSFNSPLPSATSSIPIPKSLDNPSASSSKTTTITIGTLSPSLFLPSSSPSPTSSPPTSSLPATSSAPFTSGLLTSTTSAPISTTSSTASAPAKTNGSPSHLPGPLPVLFLVLLSFALFS